MNNFNSHNLNYNNFRVMSYDDYLNEMSTLFDPSSPGGVDDELARKMSSLGRAPWATESV